MKILTIFATLCFSVCFGRIPPELFKILNKQNLSDYSYVETSARDSSLVYFYQSKFKNYCVFDKQKIFLNYLERYLKSDAKYWNHQNIQWDSFAFKSSENKEIFEQTISTIDNKIFLLIDALSFNTDKQNLTIAEILNTLSSHPIKNHVIIIENMHLLKPRFLRKKEILNKIYSINKKYSISFHKDRYFNNNAILIAQIK